MIRQQGGKWVAECDRCARKITTGQRSFQQAANYLSRAEGWDSWEHDGDWKNYCPQCVEASDPNPDLDRAGVGFTKRWMAGDDPQAKISN
jgi:hypothetical protein